MVFLKCSRNFIPLNNVFILPHVANATYLCYHSYSKKSSLFDITPHSSGEGQGE